LLAWSAGKSNLQARPLKLANQSVFLSNFGTPKLDFFRPPYIVISYYISKSQDRPLNFLPLLSMSQRFCKNIHEGRFFRFETSAMIISNWLTSLTFLALIVSVETFLYSFLLSPLQYFICHDDVLGQSTKTVQTSAVTKKKSSCKFSNCTFYKKTKRVRTKIKLKMHKM